MLLLPFRGEGDLLTNKAFHQTDHHRKVKDLELCKDIAKKFIKRSTLCIQLKLVTLTMHMAAVFFFTWFLLCCPVGASKDSKSKCDYNVAVGDTVTVTVSKALGNPNRLKWKHENKIIFDKKANIFTVGKASDIHPNGSLILANVKKQNSGTYTPEAFDSNGKSVNDLAIKRVCVYDRVKKPELKATCSDKAPFKVTLNCKVTVPEDSKFEWLKNDIPTKDTQPILIKDVKDVEKQSFKCRISNALGNETSNSVTQHCTTNTSFLFGEVLGVQIWIVILCGGGVVLLLILIVIICCVINRRKRKMHQIDEEELRLDWANNEQAQRHQHHHHRHHHNHNQQQHKHHQHAPAGDHPHQQQPAGNTGPRQPRSRQQREPRPRAPEVPGGHPQPSPRRPAQVPGPTNKNTDEEHPPPLPQPRKKAPLP